MTESTKNGAKTLAFLVIIGALAVCFFRVYGTFSVRGPYLQQANPSNIVIRWNTSRPLDGVVRYGLQPWNLDQTARHPTRTTSHELTLVNLSPATRYYYAIGYSLGPTTVNLGGGSGTTDHYFVTPPLMGSTQPVRAWVIGDSGTADANARAVRDAYLKFSEGRHTDVWLMLGDNAYDAGSDVQYQRAVFNTYPMLLRNTVLWPTLGNHDTPSLHSPKPKATNTAGSLSAPGGKSQAKGLPAGSLSNSPANLPRTGPYFDIFTLPARAESGGVSSDTESWYSFDYANIHFICLDSTRNVQISGDPMLDWLERDLAATTQMWIVAYWHHSPYSTGRRASDADQESTRMRLLVLPVLEKGGVDLVLTGHAHSYARTPLLHGHYGPSSTFTSSHHVQAGGGGATNRNTYVKSSARSPNQGTLYVVAGSSGQLETNRLDHPAFVVSENLLGSAVLDVEGSRLRFQFLGTNAAVHDTFTILKQP